MSDCRFLCGFHTICSSIVTKPLKSGGFRQVWSCSYCPSPSTGSAGWLPLRVPHAASDPRWLPHSQAGDRWPWAAIGTLHIVADTCCLLGFWGVSRAGKEVKSTFYVLTESPASRVPENGAWTLVNGRVGTCRDDTACVGACGRVACSLTHNSTRNFNRMMYSC